ncbi:unnamed protein product [Cylicocyclus nassatus]|nr:unnamed protein product [Cylicocyclus nassatus]
MVAWTTTPWTLPSNLALCLHPDLDYLIVKDPATDAEYVVMEERLCELKNDNLVVLEKVKGRTFEGKSYEPLFPYFTYMKKERNAFRGFAIHLSPQIKELVLYIKLHILERLTTKFALKMESSPRT